MSFTTDNKFGIGIDCTDIHRFESKSTTFLSKVFSRKEIDYCKKKSFPEQHYAGKFAAKEAVIKALTYFNISILPRAIEILNLESGSPYVIISKKLVPELDFKISISHSNIIATAICIVTSYE